MDVELEYQEDEDFDDCSDDERMEEPPAMHCSLCDRDLPDSSAVLAHVLSPGHNKRLMMPKSGKQKRVVQQRLLARTSWKAKGVRCISPSGKELELEEGEIVDDEEDTDEEPVPKTPAKKNSKPVVPAAPANPRDLRNRLNEMKEKQQEERKAEKRKKKNIRTREAKKRNKKAAKEEKKRIEQALEALEEEDESIAYMKHTMGFSKFQTTKRSFDEDGSSPSTSGDDMQGEETVEFQEGYEEEDTNNRARGSYEVDDDSENIEEDEDDDTRDEYETLYAPRKKFKGADGRSYRPSSEAIEIMSDSSSPSSEMDEDERDTGSDDMFAIAEGFINMLTNSRESEEDDEELTVESVLGFSSLQSTKNSSANEKAEASIITIEDDEEITDSNINNDDVEIVNDEDEEVSLIRETMGFSEFQSTKCNSLQEEYVPSIIGNRRDDPDGTKDKEGEDDSEDEETSLMRRQLGFTTFQSTKSRFHNRDLEEESCEPGEGNEEGLSAGEERPVQEVEDKASGRNTGQFVNDRMFVMVQLEGPVGPLHPESVFSPPLRVIQPNSNDVLEVVSVRRVDIIEGALGLEIIDHVEPQQEPREAREDEKEEEKMDDEGCNDGRLHNRDLEDAREPPEGDQEEVAAIEQRQEVDAPGGSANQFESTRMFLLIKLIGPDGPLPAGSIICPPLRIFSPISASALEVVGVRRVEVEIGEQGLEIFEYEDEEVPQQVQEENDEEEEMEPEPCNEGRAP